MAKAKKDRAPEFAQSIIDAIAAGQADGKWIRPWNCLGDFPHNPVTGRRFSGANALKLMIAGGGAWATYNQWQEAGAQVREGEKGILVCRPKSFTKENKDGEKEQVFTGQFIYYTVHGAHQVDGWVAPEVDTIAFSPIAAVEADMNALGVPVNHGGDRAFYVPSQDSIQMPQPEYFHSTEEYYTTLLHEGGHATGHQSRLDRDLLVGRFGDEAYAFEELVAELASVFMAQHYGIAQSETIDPNHLKYVKSWLKVLKNDPTAIQKAARLAEDAASYITDRKGEQAIAVAA